MITLQVGGSGELLEVGKGGLEGVLFLLRSDTLGGIIDNPSHHMFLLELTFGLFLGDKEVQTALDFIVGLHLTTTEFGFELKLNVFTLSVEKNLSLGGGITNGLFSLDVVTEELDHTLLPVVPAL